MKIDGLTEDQKAKARACKTPEEMLMLARDEGYELTDEELEGISGGWNTCNADSCSDDCKLRNCGTYL